MDVRRYLSRINFTGKTKPTHETLFALQEAHLLSVPFENLDIHLGIEIILDLPRIYHKIIERKRGGFCYELNGLFHWLLKELGFNCRLAMGKVYNKETDTYGQDFDHMLTLAEIESQTWIVDVGFGDFATHPLPFILDQPVRDMNGKFIIEENGGEFFRVSKYDEQKRRYIPEYIFSPEEQILDNFSGMCRYHQSDPRSHFTQGRVCSMATKTGRITLTDQKFIVTDGGVREEIDVESEMEFKRLLELYFKISF